MYNEILAGAIVAVSLLGIGYGLGVFTGWKLWGQGSIVLSGDADPDLPGVDDGDGGGRPHFPETR